MVSPIQFDSMFHKNKVPIDSVYDFTEDSH